MLNEKYYVIDDITGTPELAQVIKTDKNMVYLRSVMNPAMQYARTMDTIYATYELAVMNITTPAYIVPVIEYEYTDGYVGEYVEF